MRKFFLLLPCFLLLCLQMLAQNRVISGRVTDDKGAPVSNASVMVRDTDIGVTADVNGNFTINVPPSARALIVSSLNYEAREIALTSANNVSITLSGKNQTMNEVVVTALGIARDKRSLGYATQNIKNEELIDRGEVNVVNLLQGKVAGVDITGASGAAGASANINIRGIQSFNGNNQPLFVIDGVPISNDVDRTGNTLQDHQPPNRALDLNVNEVESVNILKGPAAAILYGSRAASGAIIITTKRGNAGRGKARVTFTSSFNQQQVTGFPEFQNKYGGGANGLYDPVSVFSWGPAFGATPGLNNGLLTATGEVIDYRAYPNNMIDFFEKGNTFENNLNVNGGDARQNYNFSIANTDQNGILPNSFYKRTNLGVKFNTPLTEKLSLGASANYVNSRQRGITQGNGTNSALFTLFSVPRSFNLPAYRNNYKNPDGTNNWPLSSTRNNPYFGAFEDPVNSTVHRAIGNIRLDYNVLNWLSVAYRLGVDAYTDRRKKIVAINSFAAPGGAGRVIEDNFFRSELNGDLLISAKKNNFLTNGLNANLLLGQNINNRTYQNVYIQADSLSIPNYYNVANASKFDQSGETNNVRRLLGYYAQLSLAYNNYLFVELTGRVDQSSTLPKANNTFFYPGISTSFVFTDALQIKSNVLSYGKLRASVAKVGKDADPFLLDNVYVTGGFGNNVAQFGFPFGTIPGWGQSSRIANNELTPEFTTSYEGGINIGFFNNRLSLDAAYFYTSSTDQIVNVGVPASTGFLTKTANVGKMTNQGVELLINARPLASKRFSWDVSANFTRIRNKVVEIGGGITSFSINGNRFTGALPTIMEGQPYGVIVGNKWQRSPDGQLLINPANGLPLGTVAGQVIADPNRDFIAGLTNTFNYGKVSFSFLWDYKQGGDIVSWGVIGYRNLGALKIQGEDRDLPRIFPGVIETTDGKYVPNNIQIPAQTYWVGMGQTSGAGDMGVFDATVLRLREVSLSVDIPGTIAGRKIFSGARFTVFGRNLFYYAPNAPFDPEINTQGAGNLRGLELQSAPTTRSLGASLRVSF
ncbi:MAG TPA: SusC/RagA family TonB-linked outer membrane protein [Flavisolibacter sp.]|jgi:TonB-linked SusC/RagA family outer membrane protein|nr:SusC/RagA family TonB-linked outer membrane protein [Flavisolibacter sp.]